jgi:hypothetical protein
MLAIFFVGADPLRVVRNYDSPTLPGVLISDRLFLGRYLVDSVSQHDGFIFGSSRSKAFKAYDWLQFDNGPDNPFHLGVNDESLFGIKCKLEFLEKAGINNPKVLIPLDHRILSLDRDHTRHVFREYWRFTGETQEQYFQYFLIAFVRPDFLWQYFAYHYGDLDTERGGDFFWDPGFCYNTEHGDIDYCRMDSMIIADSTNYYEQYSKDVFYNRAYAENYKPKRVISETGKELLEDMASSLQNMGASYKIVITPNYDQVTLHQDDLSLLKEIFGDSISDFSGISDVTANVGHYYEERHFKPYIARQIMKSLYE